MYTYHMTNYSPTTLHSQNASHYVNYNQSSCHATMGGSINKGNSNTEWANATAHGGTFLFVAPLNLQALHTSSFPSESRQSMA